jgi:hypothetical protein
MNEIPRQKLSEIITKYGDDVYNQRRCEGLLRDYCGQYKKEIFLLVNALNKGVTGELINSKNSVSTLIVLARLTKKLQDELGITEESAQWAVDSWALALGVISQPRSTEVVIDTTQDLTQDLTQDPVPASKTISKRVGIWIKLSTLLPLLFGIAYCLSLRNFNDIKNTYEQKINNLHQDVTRLDREHQNSQNTLKDLENNLYVNPQTNISANSDNYINFCNQTSRQTIDAAFMYWDGSTFRSKGWWTVKKGFCKKVLVNSSKTGTAVYIHGEVNNITWGKTTWGSTDFSFCASHPKPFNFSDAEKPKACKGGSVDLVDANKFIVMPGTNNYTFKDYSPHFFSFE